MRSRGDEGASRVLIDFRMTAGGVGRYGRDLVAGLRSLPVAPDVATVRATRAAAPFTPWGRAFVAWETWRARPDVFHALHMEVPAARSVPCVVTVPDVIPLDHPGSMPDPFRRFLFRRVIAATGRRADLVIVPSELTRTAIERYGIDAARMRKVPWGVSSVFRPITPAERVGARQRFADGRRYIATIASTRPHKNFTGLIEAAALIEAARDDLVIASTGRPLPNAPHVRFVGRLSDRDLRLFYGGAELFVLPSFVEGFGYPVLESLACGAPVVCSGDVGAVEYVADAIVVVDARDPGQIAAATLSLVAEGEQRARLAQRGLEIASAMTRERMAQDTLDVYNEALG